MITDAEETTWVDGQISATPERAAVQARKDLRQAIADWLDPDVPRSWTVPDPFLESTIVRSELESVPTKDYGDSEPMYVTHLAINKSPENRARLIEVYNHELVGRRLVNWGVRSPSS